jgi:hypothetical protein
MIEPIILPQVIKLNPVPVPDPPKPPVKKKPIIEPEAVLVSGLAFPRDRGEKIRDIFSNYSKRMAVRLNKKYPGIIITVFNFYEGAQQLYEFDGTSMTITHVKTWGKLNVDNYRYMNWKDDTFEVRKPKFDDPLLSPRNKEVYYFIGISDVFGSSSVKAREYADALFDGKIKEKSISIQNVYQHIEGMGHYKPGNLKELHFFSRGAGDDGSPVLVGAYGATYSSGSGKFKFSTKYVDKDASPADFFKTHSPGNNLADFKAAFDKDCTIVFWGSFLNRDLQADITSAVNSKGYKQALLTPDEPALLKDRYGYFWSLNDMTRFIRDDFIEPCYAYKFGEAIFRKGTKRNIYVAPPGTDATTDDEIKQKKFGDPLMHIFMGEDFEDPPKQDFRGILKFYDEAMGMEFFEPKEKYHKIYGRGYLKIY